MKLFMAAAVVLACSPASSAQWVNSAPLERFNEQIASYMSARHDAAARTGVPVASSDPADIIRNETALGRAIQKARPQAKAGDVFNDLIAIELRKRIHRVLDQHHVTDVDLLTGFGRESPSEPGRLAVNGALDWRLGATMPAAILDVLPKVPWPIEYRFVGGDLILLDVEAGLIVDVLPQVLTDAR